MNKTTLFLLLLAGTLLTGCKPSAATSAHDGCSIQGYTSFDEYQSVVLINGDTRQLMDSMALQDGKFAFKKLDSIAEPYMAVVRFINPNDSMDVMDMPVAIENGEVSITIEEYIKTKGTPINTYIQKFLDGMQALHDAMQMDRDADAKDVAEAFSSFYKEQIVTNSHNCLGKYIWKQYGMHLSAEDKEEAKTAITKN